MANITNLYFNQKPEIHTYSFLVNKTEVLIPMSLNINIEEEKKKLTEELNYLQGFLKSVNTKLGNEKFVNNAKPEIVANERKNQADALEKMTIIEEQLKKI